MLTPLEETWSTEGEIGKEGMKNMSMKTHS